MELRLSPFICSTKSASIFDIALLTSPTRSFNSTLDLSMHFAAANHRKFPMEFSANFGSIFLRRFTRWVSIEGLRDPRRSSEAAMKHFHRKDETTSTRVGHSTPAARALRLEIAEASNTNLLVMPLPFLNKEPNITTAESLSHKSFAGKREVGMNSGYIIASLLPLAMADQALRKVLSAAPSRAR
ncbi:hypothetical protein OIU78_012922 [Salix suchowensis]|nr:hypothetical protein OIU78_012922 [Salix suchowensis]